MDNWLHYKEDDIFKAMDKITTGNNCLMMKRIKAHVHMQDESIEQFAHELEDLEERTQMLYATIFRLRKEIRDLKYPKTLRSGTKY